MRWERLASNFLVILGISGVLIGEHTAKCTDGFCDELYLYLRHPMLTVYFPSV